MAVLELRGVTKLYKEREVLRGIDLTVGEREAVAVIGASGSGKSTLLRCVDLLEEIDDGDIYLDGEAITDPGCDPVPVRRRLGLVFQAYNLFPHKSVIENVVLGAVKAQGIPRAQALEAGHALLYTFDIAKPGHYRLRVMGLGRKFAMRLEDSDGWPLIAPGAEANLEQDFAAGSYRLVVLPQAVDAARSLCWRRLLRRSCWKATGLTT